MALAAVMQALEAHGFEPHLEESLEKRVVGVIVSDAFQDDQTPRQRSDRVWDVLRSKLTRDELLRVGVLLPMTRTEYHRLVPN